MCGIAGVFEYEGRKGIDRATLVEMLSLIEHRGPDDQGTLFSGSFTMGMQRLSIIDLQEGNSPSRMRMGKLRRL
jgi:asparagine synthase (glutamine-hydrolysing)